MASKKTKELIKLIENKAGDSNSLFEVPQLLEQGADITAPTKNGSMIDSVIAERNRHQNLSPQKAQCCQQIIQLLLNHASNLLAKAVFSSNEGQLDEMKQLVQLHGSCYQSDKFGPLGLLGELLKQDKVPIQLDVVKFLMVNDTHARFALTKVNNQNQTCLSIAKMNKKCPKTIITYIQNTFDMLLNKSPFIKPPIDVNDIVEWIRRGANTEAIDEHGNTVLSNSVLINNLELTRALVNAGCNLSHVNHAHLTPLDIATNATPRNAQLVTVLEAQNINTELKQLIETKKSLLTTDEVNSLLSKGATINALFTNNRTPLHILIANEGTPELITAFINDLHADIFAMDITGHRPIELCILMDKSPFTKLQTFLNLPKISTAMYFNTHLNKSILQFSKEQNRPEAETIIQNALNIRLWNLISQANTKEEHNQSLIPELHQLIGNGAQIEHKHTDKEYQQWTILHLACKITTKLFVQYLIEKLNINYLTSNGNGDYPISIASEFGHLSIVEYLRELRNIQLNISNKDKQTPLHLATKNHHLLVVRYLILWGADYRSENLNKQTPLNIARSNLSNNKKDQLNDNKLIHFLQQLICPIKSDQQENHSIKPNYDLDTCELVTQFTVNEIRVTSVGDEERLGQQSRGILAKNANENLLNAAKEGSLDSAKAAIGVGANICYKKDGINAYGMAQQYIIEYKNQCELSKTRSINDFQRYQQKLIGCQQIAEHIRQIAFNKLKQGIELSKAYHVVAYHQAGSPLTRDLLYYTCNKSDNVQIVDYLINQSTDIHQAMSDYSTVDSPYRIAQKNKFYNVASYLKYRLSLECTQAIKSNNINYVKKLIRAGASVEMDNTNNLQVAIRHKNDELIQILCDNGAKIPMEWIQSKTIILPENISQTINSDIVFRINRCLINRRLRIAAASGDLLILIQCQHLTADINSENCYGSTALLCSILHGNYFPIVHTLVSHGATMLHSNEKQSMSLIDLAKKNNYTQIADYLFQELNVQFLNTILHNDQTSAKKFEELHADFNYQDEQKRTPLHYAVQYHGIELVSWLFVRGSTPFTADVNGNYPLTEATEKGDYAVVELFVTKYPATKQQKNAAGLTALQIAQKQGFKRIAYVLETGKPAPETTEDVEAKVEGPKHTKEELFHAAKNGHLKVIKQFIDDRYDSRDDKRKLCFELIGVATKAKQYEVNNILEPYYDKQLKAELPSDIEMGSAIKLNQHYKKILLGFLTGLGQIIADSPVVLDPADPNTYKDLFSNLISNQRKRSEEIQNVASERDAIKLSEQDINSINDKLTNINNQLENLAIEKASLENKMQETDEKLKQQQNISAIQRKELFKQQEEHKKQLATYECSIFLHEHNQEATIKRKNTIKFIKENANMYLFFRTIERLLQTLFIGVLSASSGLLTTEKNSKFGTAATYIDMVPIDKIPFANTIIGAVTSTITTILSKLDEKQQKKEYLNISTFGNIEEVERIASDTATLVTLYYKEQIQSIDVSIKIKGSNIFNHATSWIKNVVIDVRPEEKEEMPVVLVAEFVTGWIIDALKAGKKKLDPAAPLPQQLWFCVAKEDCADQGNLTAVSDILGATAGRQKIPLKIKKSNGEQISTHVQLRYLIGCVAVITSDATLYQYKYPISQDPSNENLSNLELYGCVYVKPFLDAGQPWQPIRDGRHLVEIKSSEYDVQNMKNKLKDIEQYVTNFQSQDYDTRHSAITAETARQIAQVIRDEKYFVDPKDVQNSLDQSRTAIEISIDVLREDIQEKTKYYQTSIDAAHEKLEEDFDKAYEALKKENDERYNQASKKLNEQLKQIEIHLENQIMKRTNTIEKQLKLECDEMRQIVQAAKEDSKQALIKANEATQASKQSAQHSQEANEQAKRLVESTEQRRQEFETVMEKCQANVKLTITEQKAFCEETVTAIRTKVQQDFERTKQSAEGAAGAAKDAAQAAKESAKAAQETQKDTRNQLNLQKQETNKVILEAEKMRKQNEQLIEEAEEAKKQAKQGAEKTATALKKVDNLHEKMVKALERLEKLAKKLE